MNKLLIVIVVFLFSALSYGRTEESATLDVALQLLDEGDYAKAESQFGMLAAQACLAGNVPEQAVALKWQGVSLARLGHSETANATNLLWQAVGLLEPLAAGNQNAATELGFSLFNIAETLRVSAEHLLREQRVAGMQPSAYFSIVQKYMAPAESFIGKAQPHYANDWQADISYAQGEHSLLMVRLKRVFLPESSTEEGYGRASSFFDEALNLERARGAESRGDVIVSATIRLAEIGKEQAAHASEDVRHAALDRGIQRMEAIRREFSDQVESLAHLLYTIALFRMERTSDFSAATISQIEVDLLAAAEIVEQVRGKVTQGASFERSGGFFTQRTHVYEALCRLYAAVNDADKFLLSVERMRARAFRDILPTESGSRDIDLDLLRARLMKDNAAFVEFFYGPEKAWAVQGLPGKDFVIVEIPISGQELAQEVHKVIREFASPRSPRVWKRLMQGALFEHESVQMKDGFSASHRLYRILFQSLIEQSRDAGVDRMYLVPHHAMNYLSAASLVTELNETDLLRSTFLVEMGFPITYLPSCAVLSGLDERQVGQVGHVFYRTDFRSVEPTYPSPLAGTSSEARMVSDITGAQVYGEHEATEAVLRSLSGPFRFLHFATHGDLDAKNPLDTRILLAATDPDKPDADGNITVRELFQGLNGKLKADLVFLSACHTNEAEPSPASGDDLAALSRGFMVAGARSVLATQWQASDGTFPIIMEFFFREWYQQGRPKDVALMLALKRFLAENDGPSVWRHPQFWAPLILMGHAD